MEHKAPYALVGLFVCALVAALIGFLIWMQGDKEENYANYTVYFTDSVSGLEEGADVDYKGVTVGKVDGMRLAPEDENLVKVDISVKEGTPVKSTSIAKLNMVGVTGLTNLELQPPDKGDKKAPMTKKGEPFPIIEGRPSDLSQALKKAMKDVPNITQELRAFSGKLNDRMEKFDNSFVGKMLQ